MQEKKPIEIITNLNNEDKPNDRIFAYILNLSTLDIAIRALETLKNIPFMQTLFNPILDNLQVGKDRIITLYNLSRSLWEQNIAYILRWKYYNGMSINDYSTFLASNLIATGQESNTSFDFNELYSRLTANIALKARITNIYDLKQWYDMIEEYSEFNSDISDQIRSFELKRDQLFLKPTPRSEIEKFEFEKMDKISKIIPPYYLKREDYTILDLREYLPKPLSINDPPPLLPVSKGIYYNYQFIKSTQDYFSIIKNGAVDTKQTSDNLEILKNNVLLFDKSIKRVTPGIIEFTENTKSVVNAGEILQIQPAIQGLGTALATLTPGFADAASSTRALTQANLAAQESFAAVTPGIGGVTKELAKNGEQATQTTRDISKGSHSLQEFALTFKSLAAAAGIDIPLQDILDLFIKSLQNADEQTKQNKITLLDYIQTFDQLGKIVGQINIIMSQLGLASTNFGQAFQSLAGGLQGISGGLQTWKAAGSEGGLLGGLMKANAVLGIGSSLISMGAGIWRAFSGPTNEQLAAGGAAELGQQYGRWGASVDPAALQKIAEKLPRAESGKIDIWAAKVHPDTLKLILDQLTSFGPEVQRTLAASIGAGVNMLVQKTGVSMADAFRRMQPVLQGAVLKALQFGEALDQNLLNLVNHAKNLGVAIEVSTGQFSDALLDLARNGDLTQQKISNIKTLAGQLGVSLDDVAAKLRTGIASALAEMIRSGDLSASRIQSLTDLAAQFGIALSDLGRRIKDDLIAALRDMISTGDIALTQTQQLAALAEKFGLSLSQIGKALKDDITNALWEMITTGDFDPGQVQNLIALAAQFGISWGDVADGVKEKLQTLRQELRDLTQQLKDARWSLNQMARERRQARRWEIPQAERAVKDLAEQGKLTYTTQPTISMIQNSEGFSQTIETAGQTYTGMQAWNQINKALAGMTDNWTHTLKAGQYRTLMKGVQGEEAQRALDAYITAKEQLIAINEQITAQRDTIKKIQEAKKEARQIFRDSRTIWRDIKKAIKDGAPVAAQVAIAESSVGGLGKVPHKLDTLHHDLVAVKNAIKNAPQFQLGGPVAAGGLAWLHPGEFVLSPLMLDALNQGLALTAQAPARDFYDPLSRAADAARSAATAKSEVVHRTPIIIKLEDGREKRGEILSEGRVRNIVWDVLDHDSRRIRGSRVDDSQ